MVDTVSRVLTKNSYERVDLFEEFGAVYFYEKDPGVVRVGKVQARKGGEVEILRGWATFKKGKIPKDGNLTTVYSVKTLSLDPEKYPQDIKSALGESD